MLEEIVADCAARTLVCAGVRYRCAIGRGGARPATAKQEGDGATPLGSYPLRWLYYRPDRLTSPATGLTAKPLDPNDGWCDDPADAAYNRPVTRPYPARHEALWRDDHIYDLIVVLGHNDDPVVPGRGSAIFLHLARPDWRPTEGCLALADADLRAVLRDCGPATRLRIV